MCVFFLYYFHIALLSNPAFFDPPASLYTFNLLILPLPLLSDTDVIFPHFSFLEQLFLVTTAMRESPL